MNQPLSEMHFGRDDSPSETIASAFADGQVTITVQNTEVPGHACDNELTLGQAIQLRDFLNRHIDGLALAATGSAAERSSDDPTQLAAVELLQAGLDAIAPQPLPTGRVEAPAGVLHLVWNTAKNECVGFYDEQAALYAATGLIRGAEIPPIGAAFPSIGAAFRKSYATGRDLPRTTVTFY
jgi:hypothetical protein